MCENIIGRGHPAIDSSIRIIQSKSSSSQPNIDDLNIHEPHHDPESRSTEKFSKQDSLPASEHYSVFTVRQKKTILMAGSFAAFFSPLSSNVYFPAINTIAKDLHVSISQINLTVTTYHVGAILFRPNSMLLVGSNEILTLLTGTLDHYSIWPPTLGLPCKTLSLR